MKSNATTRRDIVQLIVSTLMTMAFTSCSEWIHLSKHEIVKELKEREAWTCRPCQYHADASGWAHVNGFMVPIIPLRGEVAFGGGPQGLNGAVSALGRSGTFCLDTALVTLKASGADTMKTELGTQLNEFVQDALVNQIPKIYELNNDTSFAKFKIYAYRHNVSLNRGNNRMRLYYDGTYRLRYFSINRGKNSFSMHVSRFRKSEGGMHVPTRYKIKVNGRKYSFRVKGKLRNVGIYEMMGWLKEE